MTTAPDLLQPAYLSIPERRGSYGDEAADLAKLAGRELDPEQRLAVDAMLSYGPGGKWIALESAVVEARQNGKALSTDTPLLTANRGWTTMGEIVPGDRVFHPGGHDLAVTHVSDVVLGHECYRVTTTDGRELVADADHLWSVIDKRYQRSLGSIRDRRRWFDSRTVTTRQMLATGLAREVLERESNQLGLWATDETFPEATWERRFVLPTQEPIKSADVDLPVDPYLIGAWLGDGTSSSGTLTCHEVEVDYWALAIQTAGFTPMVHRYKERACTVGITKPGNGRQTQAFAVHLRQLGMLGNKHVPDLYLTAGPTQREALLQGMLDTDGTIEPIRGQVEFCSTSWALADAALFLARSLGWRATLRVGRATLHGRDCGPKYRVCFTPKKVDPYQPFRMPRKAARVRAVDGGAGRTTVSIASIEPVESVPVRCIKVDSPDGLFLAGRDLVATHNTGGVLLPLVLFDLFLLGADRIVWTAHLFRTARDAFADFVTLIDGCPELSRRCKPPVYAKGEEAIVLHSGAKLEFLARSKGGGRGLGGKRLVMDEALFLSAESMGALIPTLSARPDPQINYGSSAGLGTSDHLRNLRDRGRAGGDPSLIWVEWCAPGGWDDPPCRLGRKCPHMVGTPGCALDDEALWPLANPALGQRIRVDYVRAERHALPAAEFGRERLGWFDLPDDVVRPISQVDWAACAVDLPDRPSGAPVFFLDCSPGLGSASICAAAMHDGKPHLELADYRSGADWLVARVADLAGKFPNARFAVFGSGAVTTLLPALEDAGVKPEAFTGPEMGRACGHLQKLVTDQAVTHSGDPLFAQALAVAVKRDIGDDLWTWSRRKSGDISPLVSATGAAWLLETRPAYDVLRSVW